jgi:peroxiredoxin
MLAKNISDSKVGKIGSDAVDFVQNDTSGNPVKLSSFRGKYVLIDFWASWCKPCRMENPTVVKAFNQYKSKNFTVLGVSLDRSKDAWVKAIADDNLTWTHVSDLKFWSNVVAVKYKVESIPQNFLLDPNGKIIAKNLRGEQLLETLKGLLN